MIQVGPTRAQNRRRRGAGGVVMVKRLENAVEVKMEVCGS
jgi:hypothetical protein